MAPTDQMAPVECGAPVDRKVVAANNAPVDKKSGQQEAADKLEDTDRQGVKCKQGTSRQGGAGR